MDEHAQWIDQMNIGKTDKVLLGITVAIITVAAATVHLWLGFIVLLASAAVLSTLTRFSSGQVKAVKSASQKPPASNAAGAVINPATGMPMAGTADVRGNLYGQNEAFGTNIYGRHDP